MSRIEVNVASQLGDVSRPRQSAVDHQEQADAARRYEADSEDQQADSVVRSDDVRSAAAELRQVIEVTSGRDLAFDVFEETHDLFVEISDVHSGEVIKQIPAEEVLHLRSRMQELVGMFFNEQA
jgi:flagellar protein FlaG